MDIPRNDPTRSVVLALLVLCLVGACHGDSADIGADDTSGSAGDSGSVDTGADTDPDSTDDPQTAEPGDCAGQPDPGLGDEVEPHEEVIRDFEVVESTRNALAVYAMWTTDVPVVSTLNVECAGDYSETFVSQESRTAHEAFVMGLAADDECEFQVVAADAAGATLDRQTACYDVPPLPAYLPQSTLVTADVEAMEPGWTLVNLNNRPEEVPLTLTLFDQQGRIRWYHQRDTTEPGSDQPAVFMGPEGVLVGGRRALRMALISWEGKLLWEAPFNGAHHEIRPTSEPGVIYFLARSTACDTVLSEPGDVIYQYDYNTDTTLWQWDFCHRYTPDPVVPDWSHCNTVAYFDTELELLLSSRNQNALIKIDRENGDIIWRMGAAGRWEDGWRGDFVIDADDRFWRQHDPEVLGNGNILMFDNGYPGHREFSRALEIAYDDSPAVMEASAVWEYRHEPDLFTEFWGDADRLANGNTLVTFGFMNPTNLTTVVEVQHDGDVVWEMTLPLNWGIYRSERVMPHLGHIVEE